ncbi:hypothetical protein GQX73_g8002 [Xylaria multiplex]|uniref:Meiotic recombination protein DMC1 n=1 Tax=Xylaria multiplex TaxID=323545 RepID=A0A7C8N399_9PEZI|nr:hypothetical protein GQX73_g8002 [Xylaria multiplex]
MAESPRIARPGPGGFLPPPNSLPSPAPSTASSRVAALLPHPRSKPLVPGSKKEEYAREYVARRLLHISRRYVKKFGIPDPADEVTGYESMDEVCRDLEEVVDVLWFSGTPSLQVPYLLNVALAFNTYLPSFPPAPKPTFLLLRKMDHCFASLLVGYDVKTKEPLPGFSSTVDNNTKMRFSRTDMVRCKSLADQTRIFVAMVMSGEVDVIDYAEDDEVVARRPACARTETPNPASHGVEIVKAEEEEDDDDDNFNLISESEEFNAPAKRKAEQMSEDIATANESPKHIKIKEEGDLGVNFSGIMLTDTGSNSPAANDSRSNDKTQFHWALEEDDESDDERQLNSTIPALGPRSTVSQEVLPSPQPSSSNAIGEAGGDNDTNNREEMLGEYDEEDEDEELQMNVGQVYQRTLVQLGQSLGESIIDD